MIRIGETAKDSITGFKGVVTARTEYLNGCARLAVQPTKLGKDGKPIEAQYFDEPQLVVIPAKRRKRTTDTGGPHASPPDRSVTPRQ